MVLAVIDTETTGFGHMKGRDDAIVQVGIAHRDIYGELKIWERHCNPGERYLDTADPIALQVNGLTKEVLRAAPPSETIADMFRFELRRNAISHLTSYNVSFDRPFVTKPPWNLDISWADCIMLRATPRGDRWPKLKVACERYGIDAAGPLHSAGHDAKLAFLLMEALNVTSQTK